MDQLGEATYTVLCALNNQIEQIEAAKDDHLRQIAALDASLQRAKSERNRLTNLIAPISRLPNELLSDIFEVCCGDRPHRHWSSYQRPFEISISHVNRRWRHAAFNTPRLWTRPSLNVLDCQHLGVVMSYLERSAPLPLDMLITLDYHPRVVFADFVFVFSLINAHVGRWRRLQVASDSHGDVRRLIENLPLTAPRLECIDIRIDPNYVDDAEHIPQSMFSAGAPSLSSLRVHGLTQLSCFPPVTTLTSLQLHIPNEDVPAIDVRNMLADLVGLIDLVLNGHILADRSLIGAVELPSLRTLRICDGEDIPGLLGLILAPSLHSLLLETLECSEIRELTLLFATSTMPIYPSLRSFAIYLFTINPVTSHHWEEFMCVFPTVTHFTLSHDSINAFLRALNPPRSSALVWPDLHTLTLLKEYGRAQADLLCEAISGRIAAGRPLRRIGLTKEALLEPEVELEWLRAHVEVNECTMIADAEKDDNLAGWVDSAS